MYSIQDFEALWLGIANPLLTPTNEEKREVMFKVWKILWRNLYSMDEYNNFTEEWKEVALKILLFYVAETGYEFELLWETFSSWDLVYMVYGKEVRFPRPYNRVENYMTLLKVVQFYEYKKTFRKSKLH